MPLSAVDEAVLAAVREHDRAVEAAGLALWLGGEPTFTDAASAEPAWLGAADGSDKLSRAIGIARRLHRPGQVFLRTLGRQYPDEPAPRWSLGLYGLRDGAPVWDGPPDPALLDADAPGGDPMALRDALATALGARAFDVPGPLPHRLVTGPPEPLVDAALLARAPLEGRAIPEGGLVDPVAVAGARLVTIGREGAHVVLELPALEGVDLAIAFLRVVGAAARRIGLRALILRGHPPPADDRVVFATVTPDPGVIEVNMAPCRTAEELYAAQRAIHLAAAAAGLSPTRRHFNGELTDSGGGGHLTFGGPRPETSPFFLHPQLLPRLLSYLSRHPSLSYAFASRAVGGSGQAARPDEQARESFDELGVALARLAASAAPTPAQLWGALAPLLTDRFGNTHRSEVNVEKLWNPYLPGRGKLGVVELRALLQAPSPEHDVARATLFRAILARLATRPYPIGLEDHGAALHDRFALPYFARLDLEEVLVDLETAGFGLGRPVVKELLADPHRRIGALALGPDTRLEVRRAIEFWPLVGDLSQQGGTTRIVDASTNRIELRLLGAKIAGVQVGVRWNGVSHRIPMVYDVSPRASAAVFGIRYRSFTPRPGLHPDLAPLDPLVLDVVTSDEAWQLELHAWIPGGGVYAALPADDDEAARRRADRFRVTRHDLAPALVPTPRHALTRYAIDTRRLG